MADNDFEREVLDRLIKIEAKLESWDSSKKQIYDNQRDIIHLQEQIKPKLLPSLIHHLRRQNELFI